LELKLSRQQGWASGLFKVR